MISSVMMKSDQRAVQQEFSCMITARSTGLFPLLMILNIFFLNANIIRYGWLHRAKCHVTETGKKYKAKHF